jgi:hypothetical protein
MTFAPCSIICLHAAAWTRAICYVLRNQKCLTSISRCSRPFRPTRPFGRLPRNAAFVRWWRPGEQAEVPEAAVSKCSKAPIRMPASIQEIRLGVCRLSLQRSKRAQKQRFKVYEASAQPGSQGRRPGGRHRARGASRIGGRLDSSSRTRRASHGDCNRRWSRVSHRRALLYNRRGDNPPSRPRRCPPCRRGRTH